MNGGSAWLGRVFGADHEGGNHTAVVLTDQSGRAEGSFATIARVLGVPDTGFVTGVDRHSIRLRTFSPVEELAQCFQTTLAAVVALGADQGVPWRVTHEKGETVEVCRDGDVCWARHLVDDAGPAQRVDPPAWLNLRVGRHEPVVRFGQARARLYVPCGSVAQLEKIAIEPVTVREACAATRCNGLVCYALDGPDRLRVRVFTTSLAGGEDRATGGAVLGIAIQLGRMGHRGELDVVQGGVDAADQGRMRLRVDPDVARIMLGGRVDPILQGRLLTS
jgi:predicted PhzF superfamily epimerase YddE/YHI9